MHVRLIVEVKMTSNLPPLKTWQFYTACRRILGTTNLTKLYKRSRRNKYFGFVLLDFIFQVYPETKKML